MNLSVVGETGFCFNARRMTLFASFTPRVAPLLMITGALALAGCAAPPDDLTGSRLAQQPAGTPQQPPDDGGDIAIAGQQAAHAILDLPEVANATVPPMVEFTGVTSIVTGPGVVDTDPYTTLLRDRMLLLTRLKLRFMEHQLPALVVAPKKGKKKAAAAPPAPAAPTGPDFQLLAELHGYFKNPYYTVQIQFVDAHTGAVLFDGHYRIAKEAQDGAPNGDPRDVYPATAPAADNSGAPPTPPDNAGYPPQPADPAPPTMTGTPQ